MVIAETFKLIKTEHVGKESEYFHVGELDVILTLLHVLIVQSQNAVSDPHISRLLRLILEFDHADWDLAVDMHAFSLIYVEKV